MLKLTKNVMVNSALLEAVCIYDSRPLVDAARRARENGKAVNLAAKPGARSVVFLLDGSVYLCPYYPPVYAGRCNTEFLVTNTKCYIKKEFVREIVLKLDAEYKRILRGCKERGNYINLAKEKKVNYFVIMQSGRIYGVHLFKESKPAEGEPAGEESYS